MSSNQTGLEMPAVDLALLERWLTGWSLSRGLPLPIWEEHWLRVEVGLPGQVRRLVFLDTGEAMQACVAQTHTPYTHLKVAVDVAVLRAALPECWTIEAPGYLMLGPALMPQRAELPPEYRLEIFPEHGATVVRILYADEEVAASGRVAIHNRFAVLDQIITAESHRRRGLATVVMLHLETMIVDAKVTERLLVATEAGRGLYDSLGWQLLSPWSTAVLGTR
jgi:GNAT superfamily N-acetyltransferase